MTLREDALHFLRAGVAAVDPEALVSRVLPTLDFDANRRVVISVGKAAKAMARGALFTSGDARGIVVSPRGGADVVPDLESFEAGHPTPDEVGVRAARAVSRLVSSLEENDELLFLLSGGASALLTLPPDGISLADVCSVTSQLTRAGADIRELNTVRKHLDQLKGGKLASLASPASVITLVLSDVVGDPLDVIGSGPMVGDSTTFGEAIAVLEARSGWSSAPASVREYLRAGERGDVPENPRADDGCFERVQVRIVGNNDLACDAVVRAARSRGYEVPTAGVIEGEARSVGVRLAHELLQMKAASTKPRARIFGGETTVTVTGEGIGGRNQELVLAAARELAGAQGVCLASLGTDGVDGTTEAAGAIADGETMQRARAQGLDADQSLAENDSGHFFAQLGDSIVTGPTGTNVMDLVILLSAERPPSLDR